MVFCAKCGTENSENSNVCVKCGARLGPSQAGNRYMRSEPMFFGFSRSIFPSLIIGALIIMIGLTYTFGQDFGQIVGGWGENFGETMGTWGENIGRTFSEWGTSFGKYFGASILIVIGILIVTNQLKRNPVYR